jgi:hypothetical protein
MHPAKPQAGFARGRAKKMQHINTRRSLIDGTRVYAHAGIDKLAGLAR